MCLTQFDPSFIFPETYEKISELLKEAQGIIQAEEPGIFREIYQWLKFQLNIKEDYNQINEILNKIKKVKINRIIKTGKPSSIK